MAQENRPQTRSELAADRWPGSDAPWPDRLAFITAMMKEVSRQREPALMAEVYGSRVEQMIKRDAFIALSRRDLQFPKYRITRSSRWTEDIDPWKQKDKLPLLEGGLLGELIYADEPRIINDFCAMPDDPAYEYVKGYRSLMALPHYEDGAAINMTVQMLHEPNGFDPERLPDLTQMSTLFGRAVKNLVLSRDLKEALDALDREMKTIAELQQSLLPRSTPLVPGLLLAAHYQASKVAGGDYYDFFNLPGGRLGILIADVSGHGAPAAVLMAVLHALAHTLPEEPLHPDRTLRSLNTRLSERYTDGGAFVTAFYGVYDPSTRELRYANAGHPPPLHAHQETRECTECRVNSLDGAANLPLGVLPETSYEETTIRLTPGDVVLMYTDGISEAMNRSGDMYGDERLFEVISRPHESAGSVLEQVLSDVAVFTAGMPAGDDRTVLAIRAV